MEFAITNFHFQDGGSYCGVHARDPLGNFITIIDNDPNSNSLIGETSGIAFSPDAMRMYVSYQTPGIIFEIRRTDGLSFGSATARV
jgi:secreted PhoX family phosphatase